MKKFSALLFLLALVCLLLPAGALASDATAIGEDIYAFEAVIDGVLYQFPCSYSTLEEQGWKFKNKEEAEESMGSGRYTGIYLEKGGLGERMGMRANFLNFDINALPLSQCYVGGVEMEVPFGKDDVWASTVLAKGIELGKATREDIVAAYGEPSDLHESDSKDIDSVTLTYKLATYQEVRLNVWDGVLRTIEIKNFVEPKDLVQSSVSEEVPAYIQAYVAPTELGEDLLSFVVEFEGDLYRMPAPVSAFVANGWKATRTKYDFVQARGFAVRGIKLMRDNKNSDFSLRNLSDLAATPENCVVDSLNPIGGNASEFSIVLPGGIKVGSTKADLLKKHEDVLTDMKKEDKYTRYVCSEYRSHTINIYVDNATELVTNIEISVP